jgi:hypothetical protein
MASKILDLPEPVGPEMTKSPASPRIPDVNGIE